LAIFGLPEKAETRPKREKLGLCMAGVMIFDTLRQQTFTASLSPTREGGTAPLRFHARAKTMLAFARSFRCLIGAFHGAVEGTGTVKVTLRLSMP